MCSGVAAGRSETLRSTRRRRGRRVRDLRGQVGSCRGRHHLYLTAAPSSLPGGAEVHSHHRWWNGASCLLLSHTCPEPREDVSRSPTDHLVDVPLPSTASKRRDCAPPSLPGRLVPLSFLAPCLLMRPFGSRACPQAAQCLNYDSRASCTPSRCLPNWAPITCPRQHAIT